MKTCFHKKCGVFEACKKVKDFFDTLSPTGKPSDNCWPKYPAVPLGFDYNLHKKAGGSPKLCFSASNVRPEPGGLQSADSNRHPLLKMWV